jgi:negative regulator of sigma E activity
MEFWNRRDNGKGDAGHFDWAAGLARLDNGRQYPLEAGTQDLLSMFGQLALMAIDGNGLSMPVATGKKVERYDFAWVGEERIDTPRGERPALHLRNRSPNGKEATEIWLGLDEGRLPIKIRHIDRRGDIFDQVAERIEFEETEGRR